MTCKPQYKPLPPLSQRIRQAVLAGDYEQAEKIYHDWRHDPINAYAHPEQEINSLGYELMAEKRLQEAVKVFRMNAAAFPDSPNAHDSLGEAYAALGNREAAILEYKKALQLAPDFSSAKDALKRLTE